jgi:hypothetical protein
VTASRSRPTGSLWNDTYASYRDGIFLNSRPVGPAGLFLLTIGANTSCADFSAYPREKGVSGDALLSPFYRLLSRVAQGPVLASMSHPGTTRNWVCFASRGPNTSTFVPSGQESCGRSQIGFVWRFSGASGSLTLHWPLVTGHSFLATRHSPLAPIPSHSPYQKHPTPRAAFRLGR